MNTRSQRLTDLVRAAERSVKAAERSVLALEAIISQTKGIVAELREAIAEGTGVESANPPRPSRPRRKPARAIP